VEQAEIQGGVANPLSPEQCKRKFLHLILLAWNLPPVIGLSFIVFTGVLTPSQMLDILTTPTEPAYIIAWIIFSAWYFPRLIRPIINCIGPEECDAELSQQALKVLRWFPLHFWGIFLLYLVLAPVSVILSAEYYTDYVAQPVDWFRIQLIALIVSIIVGLPIFFLIYDLFGRALSNVHISRPYVSLKAKVFMIGALVPLLIDTMLVQYFWTRTGYFSIETFIIWLALEVLAVIGSLIFVHSVGQSLSPLQQLIVTTDKQTLAAIDKLKPLSTDELGVLTTGYAKLLTDLQIRNEILHLNSRLQFERDSVEAMGQVMVGMLEMCCKYAQGDKAFLMLQDEASNELVGVAQTVEGYNQQGHYRLPMDEQSMAVRAFKQGSTMVINDCETDPRINEQMRERFNVRSALAVPLMIQGEPIGVLMVVSHRHRQQYKQDEVDLVELLVQETVVAIHAGRVRSQQLRAEVALQQSQQRYRQLVESSSSIPWELDLEAWRFTYVGPQAVSVLGYPVEDWYKDSFWQDHIYDDDRDEVVNFCVAATARGEDHEFEYRMMAADGSIVWLRDSVNIVVEDGKQTKLQGFMFDITRQKQERDALRQSEDRFSRFFQSNPAAVLISNMEDGRVIDINQAFEDLFAYSLQEIKGKTTAEFGLWLNPQDRQPMIEQIRRDGYLKYEVRTLVSRHGVHIQVQFAVHPIELDGKECLITVLQDVTEHARIEDTIKTLAKSSSVVAYEEFLQLAVRNLAQVYRSRFAFVGMLLPGGHQVKTLAVWAGDSFVDNFTYDLEGTPCQDVLNLKLELVDHDAWQSYPQDVMLKNMGVESYFGSPLISSDNKLLGLVSVMDVRPMNIEKWVEPVLQLFSTRMAAEMERQLTYEELQMHRNHLEDMVQKRTAEMKNLNKELEAFSYSVSHDLRAPLRAISGFSQALIEDYEGVLDADARDYLQRIRNGANRMSDLIDDLLNLSRVTRSSMEVSQVDLSAMIRDVFDELMHHEPDRDVEFNVQDNMQVTGDKRLLKIVLENLVGNAWKYTGKQSKAQIELGTSTENGERVFFIRDNGVGFDMQYASKLFGAFQRLHGKDEFEGSGIGLATVQRIIHRHKGDIWAMAEPGQGATFYFKLPELEQ